MQAQYKRDYEKSNMVFRQEFLSGNALFQQQMLLENTIDGLLPCTLHSFNGETELFYDITGKQKYYLNIYTGDKDSAEKIKNKIKADPAEFSRYLDKYFE